MGVGRLKQLGVTEEWGRPLVLPTKYQDLREPLTPSLLFVGEKGVYVRAWVDRPADTPYRPGKPPRMWARLRDETAFPVEVVAFGDCRELEKAMARAGQEVHLIGDIGSFRDELQIQNPQLVPDRWRGRIRPVYPGKPKVIRPDTVERHIHEALADDIPAAAARIRAVLERAEPSFDEGWMLDQAKAPGGALEGTLWAVHQPASVAEGEAACWALDRVSARVLIAEARAGRPGHDSRSAVPCEFRTIAAAIEETGMVPSPSQEHALAEVAEDLVSNQPMRRLLSGDVGSGKTLVFGGVAAALALQGGRTCILTYNAPLAQQIAGEIASWWPRIPVALVTGEGWEGDPDAPIMVGTTALLHRDGLPKPDLMVVDEQQKFSREQREAIVDPATNLMEATATCIPRSAALLQFGGLEVSRIHPWADKAIATHLHSINDRAAVFGAVQETVAAGDQVLVVYPLAEHESTEEARRTAGQAIQTWERHFPGRCRLIHGRMTDAEKRGALQALRDGNAQVLVATTVVEVGVDLPALRHGVVVDADRFGLTTLHQIRGRLGRKGGWGRFDLLTRKYDDAKIRNRLSVLTRTQDGFEVALADLRNRGFGSLDANADTQSGTALGILPGRAVTPDLAEAVAAWDNSAPIDNGGAEPADPPADDRPPIDVSGADQQDLFSD